MYFAVISQFKIVTLPRNRKTSCRKPYPVDAGRAHL